MESWFCWIYLLTLFRQTSADPTTPPHYTIHHHLFTFDEATDSCSPGVLTSLATKQEVTEILSLVSERATRLHQTEFTFWVGLRKAKDACVVSTLPLRGFKWMEDGSKDSQVSIHWNEEPENTCTTVRCAALKGRLDGSEVTWALTSVTCKHRYQFICKLREDSVKPATPEPAIPEPLRTITSEPPTTITSEPPTTTTTTTAPPNRATEVSPKPVTSEPSKPATPAKLEPRPATQMPEPAKPKLQTDEKPETGSELQESGGPGQDSCEQPDIPHSRSIGPEDDNKTRIHVECWFDQLDLHCSGRPAIWRLLDDSPANFTTICLPCDPGFQKDASRNCVDVDECAGGGGGCRHSCLNTEGSFRCFCSDENGKDHEEDSPECTDGILIPVLVAVAALLVLLVVVAVTVKCCLMRRSKERAMKKAEKMAMESKDSFETANEKA